MDSLSTEIWRLLVEAMADKDGKVNMKAQETLHKIMTVIEDRATKAYSEFIG
jgi:hypothetical protein